MMCKILSVHLWLIFTLAVGQANCLTPAQDRKVKFGETLTLYTGEAAETEDAKLKIRLKGVGRTISEAGEVEYVELQVRLNNTEQLITISERSKGAKTVGAYVIKLVNAESFGKAHCRLKISRRASEN